MRKIDDKKKKVIVIAGVVIIISIFSGFSTNEEQEVVEGLLEQRTQILQQALFNQITIEVAESKLKNIETNPLLGEDIRNLRAFNNTDLDIIKNMGILKIEEERRLLEYYTFDVNILWEMCGTESNYFIENEYYVVLKKNGGIYKISSFNPK